MNWSLPRIETQSFSNWFGSVSLGVAVSCDIRIDAPWPRVRPARGPAEGVVGNARAVVDRPCQVVSGSGGVRRSARGYRPGPAIASRKLEAIRDLRWVRAPAPPCKAIPGQKIGRSSR